MVIITYTDNPQTPLQRMSECVSPLFKSNPRTCTGQLEFRIEILLSGRKIQYIYHSQLKTVYLRIRALWGAIIMFMCEGYTGSSPGTVRH